MTDHKMDTIEACVDFIEKQIRTLERDIEAPEIRNLDRILDQQDGIEAIIERDGYINSLKKSIAENSRFIENIRKSCTQLNLKSIKDRQELFATHSKELEKFQMQQLKSINDDFNRHKEILEQRKNEIQSLKKETENEEKNRESILLEIEKNLEKQLQNRQQNFEHSRSKDVTL